MILFNKRSSRGIVRSSKQIYTKLTSFLKIIENVIIIFIRMKGEKKITKLRSRENLSKKQSNWFISTQSTAKTTLCLTKSFKKTHYRR